MAGGAGLIHTRRIHTRNRDHAARWTLHEQREHTRAAGAFRAAAQCDANRLAASLDPRRAYSHAAADDAAADDAAADDAAADDPTTPQLCAGSAPRLRSRAAGVRAAARIRAASRLSTAPGVCAAAARPAARSRATAHLFHAKRVLPLPQRQV